MEEETKPEETPGIPVKPEEKKELTALEKIQEERDALEKATVEAQKVATELKELKTEQILSGKTDTTPPEKKTEEQSNADYLADAMAGKIGE